MSVVFEDGATRLTVCHCCAACYVRLRYKSNNLRMAPKLLSVRAGCRQVIGVSGDCSRERLQAV